MYRPAANRNFGVGTV